MKRTKLCFKDIHELAELCLIKCYFFVKQRNQNIKKLETYPIIFYGCFICKLHSEFGTQNHCRRINLKSGSKNVQAIPALTNVQIKPHSCIPTDTITSIFKEFLARATKICSEKYLRVEIKYLVDIFCKNGHDRKALQKLINSFEKKTRGTKNNINNRNTNKKQTFLNTKIRIKNQKGNRNVWIFSSVSNGP